MHGHDLSPLLKNPDADWPHTTMLPFTADKFGADCDRVPEPPGNQHKTGIPWYVLVVEGNYKYIRTLQANEPEELYDLKSDPDELTNLALDPSRKELVKKLRESAIAELRRTNAKMVDTLPSIQE
jgi:arylsulfatase A-like enzyme